ncbi:MAG: prepilin-type N-terminal cleavage/methylation domain-containing protein [Oscillospiraceae bacterium]
MFKKLKSNKKGFTLVEVIVVLVILAILAAIMIPSMTGWIDKAKNQSILVEARSALLAAQTLVSEKYAKANGVTVTFGTKAGTSVVTYAEIKDLAKFLGTASGGTANKDGLVMGLMYTDAGGRSISYKVDTNGVGAWGDVITP